MKVARRHVGLRVALDPVVEGDDVEHLEVLPLVLVEPFHQDVEEARGIDDDAGPLLDHRRQDALVFVPSPCCQSLWNSASAAKASSLRNSSGCVTQPSPIRSVMSRARPGLLEHHPAAGSHAVGHVAEKLRVDLVEIPQHRLFQKFGVQRGDAVDRVAADRGQVRHAHVPLAAFVDDRQARDALRRPPRGTRRTSSRKRRLIS